MRLCFLACACLLACSDVRIVPNDGGGAADDGAGGDVGVGAGAPGGGGTGGTGGAPVAEPRLIELALIGPQDGDLEGVGVLVNRADGSLRTSYSGLELPVMTEVEDGDMVSFAVPDDEPETRLESYRVRPDVWRIAVSAPPSGSGCEDLEPMSVTLEIPFVAGAEHYRVHTREKIFQVEPGVQTIELEPCTADTQPLLVVASGASYVDALAFDYLEVDYVPGGSATLALALASDRQEIALITGDSAVDVNGWWIPDARPFIFSSNVSEWQTIPGGYAQSFIAPGGGYAWMNVFGAPGVTPDGFCTGSHQQLRIPSTSAPVTLDVSTLDLAQPIPLADGGVAFADDGLRGDTIYRAFSNDIDVYYWALYDDPEAESLPVVFPELPAGDPWSLDPGGPLAPYGDIVHSDRDLYAGYADFAAQLEVTSYSPQRWRSVGPCD